MAQESEFERLEQFVGNLLRKYDQLRDENGRIEKLLQQRETEIDALRKELASADSARGDISSRVKSLIDQIEEWESSLPEKADDREDVSPYAGSQVVEKKTGEGKEGVLQKNLFNVEPGMSPFGS